MKANSCRIANPDVESPEEVYRSLCSPTSRCIVSEGYQKSPSPPPRRVETLNEKGPRRMWTCAPLDA